MAEQEQEKSDERRDGLFAWAESMLLRHRVAFNLVVHALLFALALFLAFLVRFEVLESEAAGWFGLFLQWLPFFVGVKLLIFGWMKLYRGGWQYAGVRDLVNILVACWVYAFVVWVLIVLFRALPTWIQVDVPYVGDYFKRLPQGVLFVDVLVSMFLVCAARLGFRIYHEELRPISQEGVRRVLVVGAGDAAETIVREMFRMPVERYRVVGLIDDDPAKQGMLIHGVPVLGTTEDIKAVCQEEEVEEIIIAMPSATQKQLRRVIEQCSGTKLKFQSLPGVSDLIDGRVTVSQMRPVDINDLLGREVVELDTEAIERFIRGRRVLITGAGGSIGAEMCRQVVNYQPAELILVEQAENPLFEIDGELRSGHPDMPLRACICDIYDRQRVMDLWDIYRPEVVIHAAAHKHVPLMEQNPCEAIKNNVLGTKNVADASCSCGAAEFVMISTDKAVNPSSVMGVSKRMAEIYTQALNGRDNCRTQLKAVRFGNVLGSAGSVVPTFRKQIAAGGPVRVTHPEMTRYFMTIPEAAHLVLQAAATGTGGQLYLLDMGEPVKIVDLARQMITLSGFRPGEDIDIVFTGIRPGEKLFEELRTAGENIEPTVHPKVLIWKSRPSRWGDVEKAIAQLSALQNAVDRDDIVAAFKKLVPEYQPPNPPGAEESAPTAEEAEEG